MANTLLAITALLELLSATSRILGRVQEISLMIQRARGENRDLTAEELASIDEVVNAARDRALKA